MIGHFKAGVGITIFLVFFFGVVVSGTADDFIADDRLQDLGVTQEDLEFTVELPNPNPSEFNLSDDIVDSSNVEVVDTQNLSDPDYATGQFLRLENQSESGWVIYNLQSSTNYLETTVTYYGLLDVSQIDMEEYANLDDSSSPLDTTALGGQQSWELNNNANYIRFVIQPSDDGIYKLVEKDALQAGLLERLGKYLGAFVGTFAAWLTLITALPPVLWMLSAILLIVAAFVLAEVILW